MINITIQNTENNDNVNYNDFFKIITGTFVSSIKWKILAFFFNFESPNEKISSKNGLFQLLPH